jgi:hypothetical protein
MGTPTPGASSSSTPEVVEEDARVVVVEEDARVVVVEEGASVVAEEFVGALPPKSVAHPATSAAAPNANARRTLILHRATSGRNRADRRDAEVEGLGFAWANLITRWRVSS